jgi:hypothetical protein
MIPLLLAFFTLGVLLCLLVGVDHLAGFDPGVADPASPGTRHPHPPNGELPPGRPVDSVPMDAGSTRGP